MVHMGELMKSHWTLLAAAALAAIIATPAMARPRIVLYSGTDFQGRSVELDHRVRDLNDYDFNDRTQSVRVEGVWEICAAKNFGNCITVDHDIRNLKHRDMNRRASSVRPVGGDDGDDFDHHHHDHGGDHDGDHM